MADGKHKGPPLYVRIKQANMDSLHALRAVAFMIVKFELSDRDDVKARYTVINKETWDSKGVYFHARLKHKGY